MNIRTVSFLTALLFLATPLALVPVVVGQAEPATDCLSGGPECAAPCELGPGTVGEADPLYNLVCGVLSEAKGNGAPISFSGQPDYDNDGRVDRAQVNAPGGARFVQMDFFLTRAGDGAPFDIVGGGDYNVPVNNVMVYYPHNGNRVYPSDTASVYYLTNHYNDEAGHIGLYHVTPNKVGFGVCDVCFEPVTNRLALQAGPEQDVGGPTPGLLVPRDNGIVFDFDFSEDSITESGRDPNGLETAMLFGLGPNPLSLLFDDMPVIYPDGFPVNLGHLHLKEMPDGAGVALFATRYSNLDDDRSTDVQETPCQPSGVFSNPFYGEADCYNFDGDAFENVDDPRPTIPDSILEATLTVVGATSREAPFAPVLALDCNGAPGSGLLQRRAGTGSFTNSIAVTCGTQFTAPAIKEGTGLDVPYSYRAVINDPRAGGAQALSTLAGVTVLGNDIETVTIRAICLSAAPQCDFNGNQGAATIGTVHSLAGITYNEYGFPLVDPHPDADDFYTVQYWVSHDSANAEGGQYLQCVRVDNQPLPAADSNGNYPNSCQGAFFSSAPATGVYKVGGHSGTSVTASRTYQPGQVITEKTMNFALDSGGRTAGALSSVAFFVPIPQELEAKPSFIEASGPLTPVDQGAPDANLGIPTTFRALVFDAGRANRLVGQGETIGPAAFHVDLVYTTTDPSVGTPTYTTVAMSDVRTPCANQLVSPPVLGPLVRVYQAKNPQTCPDGSTTVNGALDISVEDGAGNVEYTDGNTNNGELFKAVRTLANGQKVWYYYTMVDEAGNTAREPAAGFLDLTPGAAGPVVPGVPLPNPIQVITNPECSFGPFDPAFGTIEYDPFASDPDCGSINDAIPVGLPGDANDFWDTNGDGIRSGQPNGQNDLVEQFILHLNPDEVGQPDNDDHFSGVSPNGYTLHVHVEPGFQTRTSDTVTIRVGDVFATPSFEELLVIEILDIPATVCIGFVDGTPVIYSSDAVTEALWQSDFIEFFGYPAAEDYSFNANPAYPCGHPATEQAVESLLTGYDPVTGADNLDPFWWCCYAEYQEGKWFDIIDENGDGVPENVKIRIADPVSCLDVCQPMEIDLSGPLDPVAPLVGAVVEAVNDLCDLQDFESCLPPACDDEFSEVPCIPNVTPPCDMNAPLQCVPALEACEDDFSNFPCIPAAAPPCDPAVPTSCLDLLEPCDEELGNFPCIPSVTPPGGEPNPCDDGNMENNAGCTPCEGDLKNDEGCQPEPQPCDDTDPTAECFDPTTLLNEVCADGSPLAPTPVCDEDADPTAVLTACLDDDEETVCLLDDVPVPDVVGMLCSEEPFASSPVCDPESDPTAALMACLDEDPETVCVLDDVPEPSEALPEQCSQTMGLAVCRSPEGGPRGLLGLGIRIEVFAIGITI